MKSSSFCRFVETKVNFSLSCEQVNLQQTVYRQTNLQSSKQTHRQTHTATNPKKVHAQANARTDKQANEKKLQLVARHARAAHSADG